MPQDRFPSISIRFVLSIVRAGLRRPCRHVAEKSLALIGNASGRFSQPNPVLPLLPRGIFDKET